MAKHAQGESARHRLMAAASSVLAWHDARPRAAMNSPRGWVWMALIAAVFFWMSNPLVFVPGFHLALAKAITWTTVVVIVTLPWMRVPRVPWPWILFHGLAALSIVWTIDPHLTDYTNVLYLKITAIALCVAANCDARVVAWGLGLGGVVVTALSIYAYRAEMWGASYIEYLEDGPASVLAGVGTNENILAYTLVIALAAMLATSMPRGLLGRAAWLGLVGANAGGLYLAASGTSVVAVLAVILAVAAIAIWPMLRSRPRRHRLLGGGFVVAALAVGLTLVVVVLGKDLTSFSGRAPLWRAAWESTLDRSPWLGSGWGAVWTHPWSMVPPNEVAQDIADRTGYPLSHGHNFFVDVLPELGLLGVTIGGVMVAYVIRAIRRSGLRLGGPNPDAGRLALLVLVALLASGITEPMLTTPLGWWCLALVAATSSLPTARRPSTSRVGSHRETPVGPPPVLVRTPAADGINDD